MVKMRLIASSLALVAAMVSMPAGAVSFILTDGGGASKGTLARQGFEIATGYWSSVLTDNVNINLRIAFSPLGGGTIGNANPTRIPIGVDATLSALRADASSALDATAVANLPETTRGQYGVGAVTFVGNALNANNNGYLDSATRIDNDGGLNNSVLATNLATARAAGLTKDVNGRSIDFSKSDGTVQFNRDFKFDFDPTDGIASNALDFIGVAIHEIGHVLGFISGVDTVDARTPPKGGSATGGNLEGSPVFTPLDLFRYGSDGMLNWSTQGTPYFSIDGGETQVFGNALFSTGANGDNRNPSHWKDGKGLGVLDPTSGYGERLSVSALDLAAYDAIGYNVAFDVLKDPGYRVSTADIYRQFAGQAQVQPVPEPATWAMMLIGFGMIASAMRYRRRRVGGTVAGRS